MSELRKAFLKSTGLTFDIDKMLESMSENKKIEMINKINWQMKSGIIADNIKTEQAEHNVDTIIGVAKKLNLDNIDLDGDGEISDDEKQINEIISIAKEKKEEIIEYKKEQEGSIEEPTDKDICSISTEEELFNACINSGKYELVNDIYVESSIIVESDVVLNLNNHSIVNTKVINNDCTTFEVKNGAKLTIEGNGVVKSVAETSKDYSSAVWANGGYVEIKGGQFENEGDSTDLIYASNAGNIVIEGGIFKAAGPANITDTNGTANIHSALNVKDANYKDGTSSIIVKGGKFYNFNPANNVSEGKNTNFVAEGYIVMVNGVENLDCYTSEIGDIIYEVVKA